MAFDTPGGQRVELITGADGRVTFDAIDWSLGTATVTAFKFGYSMRSGVNIDPAWVDAMHKINGDVMLLLWEMEAPPAPAVVNVTGTASGLVDQAHEYVVTTLGHPNGTANAYAGNTVYSTQVTSGEPFTIIAFEQEYADLPSGQGHQRTIHRVMTLDHSAVTTPTQGVVLDFVANEAATYTADAWYDLPSRVDSPLHDGVPRAAVCSANSAQCHGWATFVDINFAGGRFDVSYLWTEPTVVDGVWTQFEVQNGQVFSFVRQFGNPTAGDQGVLYDVPRWISPADPNVARSLWDPLE